MKRKVLRFPLFGIQYPFPTGHFSLLGHKRQRKLSVDHSFKETQCNKRTSTGGCKGLCLLSASGGIESGECCLIPLRDRWASFWILATRWGNKSLWMSSRIILTKLVQEGCVPQARKDDSCCLSNLQTHWPSQCNAAGTKWLHLLKNWEVLEDRD